MEYLIAYVKDHMISRKGVAMYLVLFVTGSLLILASQIVGRGEDAAAERQRTQEEEKRHAELAGIITDVQSIRLESENLLAGLKTVGEEDSSILEQLLDYEIQFTSVDARIKELVSQLPREVATEQRRHEGVAQAQLEAQARAAELSVLMRPKVEEAFGLIRATIAKAALQGLVRVQSVTDPALPEPVMMSAYQSRGRSRALEDSGLVISFTKDWQWHVYLEPGHVKSDLAERREGSDFAYPMVRVTENGNVLATVGFDLNTTDLTIITSDASSRFAQSLVVMRREYQREELVANAILELLQDAKDRRPTG